MTHPLDDPSVRRELNRFPGERRQNAAARDRFDERLVEALGGAAREATHRASLAVLLLCAALILVLGLLAVVLTSGGCL